MDMGIIPLSVGTPGTNLPNYIVTIASQSSPSKTIGRQIAASDHLGDLISSLSRRREGAICCTARTM